MERRVHDDCSVQRVHSVPHTGGACFIVRDISIRMQMFSPERCLRDF